jgi:hypothetical protein
LGACVRRNSLPPLAGVRLILLNDRLALEQPGLELGQRQAPRRLVRRHVVGQLVTLRHHAPHHVLTPRHIVAGDDMRQVISNLRRQEDGDASWELLGSGGGGPTHLMIKKVALTPASRSSSRMASVLSVGASSMVRARRGVCVGEKKTTYDGAEEERKHRFGALQVLPLSHAGHARHSGL